MLIPANVQIDPVAFNWLAVNSTNNVSLTVAQLGEGVRAPVNLSFNALGAVDNFNSGFLLVRGDFVMEEGAGIQVDPKGSVSMSGNTVTILGSVIAPGGAISVNGANAFPSNIIVNNPEPTVDIGPKAVLSTAGTVLYTPDTSGNNYILGSVLPGGSISISGNIVAQAGALLDVSGATGMLDVIPSAAQQPFAGKSAGESDRHGDPYTRRQQRRLDHPGGRAGIVHRCNARRRCGRPLRDRRKSHRLIRSFPRTGHGESVYSA